MIVNSTVNTPSGVNSNVSAEESPLNMMNKQAVQKQLRQSFKDFLINAIVNYPAMVNFLKESESIIELVDTSVSVDTILATDGGVDALTALNDLRKTVGKLEGDVLTAQLNELGDPELLHLYAHVANQDGEMKHTRFCTELADYWLNIDRYVRQLRSVMDSVQRKRLPVKTAIHDSEGKFVMYTSHRSEGASDVRLSHG